MTRLLLVVLLVLASTAYASDDEPAVTSYRAVVDRVDFEPASITGYRLRVYLSALALGGQRLDLTDPKSIKLYVGAGHKKFPYALGRYAATDSQTAIVFLVQVTLDYSDVLSAIAESIERDVLANLPDATEVAVLPFGETPGRSRLAPVRQVRGKVSLASDNSATDPTLLDALDRALQMLRTAKATPEELPLRKMIVIVGDGRDLSGDRDRVRSLGDRAARDGVRIHSLAFSAHDVRRPMLALGELSKRSLGTFRWIRTAAAGAWKAAFEQLRDEINEQYVLTFFVGRDDDVAGRRLHIGVVGRTETKSNEVRIPDPSCGNTECTTGYCAGTTCLRYDDGGGRGVLGWILLVGGILVGAAVVLGVIGYFITRRQQSSPGQPVIAPGQVPGHVPAVPGQVPGQVPAQPPGYVPGRAAVAQVGVLPNGRPAPVLMITSGPRTGERHVLFNGFLIGKQPGCHLVLDDGYASSQHAQIGIDAHGRCMIYDRGSTNGTYVNGVRIAESALHHGIVIKIGSTEMRFLAE